MSGATSPGLKSPPATDAGAKRAYPPIRYNNYCEAQQGIAAFNSRVTGKVYKAPCDIEAPPTPKPEEKPKAPAQEPGTA
ncbi:protein of unknown function [Hyphomicrobium sp. 1Nfss2.1]|uniref:hypothetical protein n=1 Tax=Hyphomicrobium sp. 1Nfss2.1 TaxID=3413936 RepID=UPI003C7A93CD